MLKIEALKSSLFYSPETGHFTWLIAPSGNVRIGSRAGTVTGSPEKMRSVMVQGTQYLEHRLAWFYMTGEWPPDFVDHKDGNRLNNKWDNLRLATNSQNLANAKRPTTNTSGFKGVTFNKSSAKWQAQIKKAGKSYYLGLFPTPREAHKAYIAAAQRLFGEFARAK